MYYTYIPKLSNNDYYTGSTTNLKQRFADHQEGKNISTKPFRPVQLIYYSAFPTKTQAVKFELLAFIALGFWLIAKQPVISAVLATGIDLLGFAPTIRKSWNKPYTETLSFYMLNTMRFVLAVFALQIYTVPTALYPIAWIFGNGLFGLMLIMRRKQLER